MFNLCVIQLYYVKDMIKIIIDKEIEKMIGKWMV